VNPEWESIWTREQDRIAGALGVCRAEWVAALMDATRSPTLPAAVMGASAALKQPSVPVDDSLRERLRARIDELVSDADRPDRPPGDRSPGASAIRSAIAEGGAGRERGRAFRRLKAAREAVRRPERAADGEAPSAGRATPDAPGGTG
jgi:hypothetical protein